jgi:hypothetical protein
MFDALPHADEAVVLRFFRLIQRRIEPNAVVPDRHMELSGIEAQRDPQTARSGMPDGVSERLSNQQKQASLRFSADGDGRPRHVDLNGDASVQPRSIAS